MPSVLKTKLFFAFVIFIWLPGMAYLYGQEYMPALWMRQNLYQFLIVLYTMCSPGLLFLFFFMPIEEGKSCGK